MLIILEGPDCAGKSTLASDIKRRIWSRGDGVDIFHRGPPTRHPLDEYVTPLLEYRPGRPHIICDRWHLGELVYPQILGRPTRMDPAVTWYIEMFLRSRGASITVLRPPFDELMVRYAVRGDRFIATDQMMAVWEAFNQLEPLSPARRTPDEVIASATGAAQRAQRLNRLVTYVGDPTPDVVFVGDVRNCVGVHCTHRDRHSPLGTAFMPYPATSGHYLLRSLLAAVDLKWISTVRVGLINACDVDSVPLADDALYGPNLVTLGVQANKKLIKLGIPHAAAPHPQYVRRFHNSAMPAYGKLLSNIIGTERNELQWRPSSADRPASVSTRTSSGASSKRVSRV